jgi:methylmalonyl-CoA mutase cobalamin-binding subunit
MALARRSALVLRREGVEHALVLAGGEQPALDAQLVHQAGEAEAVHQHADAAHQAGLVDVDLVGGHRDVVGAEAQISSTTA